MYSYGDKALTYEGQKYPYVFFHMHGTKFDLLNRVLTQTALDCEMTDSLRRYFFVPYAELVGLIYSKYFGKDVDKVKVKGRNKLQMKIIHLRGRFRSNKVAAFLWYNILWKKYDGHETKKL